MQKSIVRAAAALFATGLLMQASAFAQTATDTVTFVAKEQPGEMSHWSLIGLNIKNAANETVGDINYLVVDPKGQVTTVVIGVGGVLGMGEKNIGVPFSALTLSYDANKNLQARLNTTKEALRTAPAFTWTEKSVMEQVKEKAKDWSEKAQEKAKDWSEKAKEKASEVKEKMESK